MKVENRTDYLDIITKGTNEPLSPTEAAFLREVGSVARIYTTLSERVSSPEVTLSAAITFTAACIFAQEQLVPGTSRADIFAAIEKIIDVTGARVLENRETKAAIESVNPKSRTAC